VSQQPAQNPRPRRKPAEAAPGARRRLRTAWQSTRDRLGRTHLPRPRLKKPSRKAMAWTGGVLALLAVAIAILIAVWDWNWFRGPLARYASARTHRQVTISGDLDVHLFSWRPSATVSGVTIANPKWAGPGNLGRFETISVKIRLIPLLWGNLDVRRLEFDRPVLRLYADAQGRKTWDFSDGRDQSPAKLPPIHNFIVKDGRISYKDVRRKLTFDASLNAHERLYEHRRGFEMTGRGTLNNQPFRMEVTGGPLVNIDRSAPYPFSADIQAGRTVVTARGAIPQPFDFGRFHMALTARGPDMAELYPLTGIALPNTPPYNLRGQLTRQELLWKIDGISGTVGRSDLAGGLSVQTGRERPLLKADLRSRSLNFPDLGAVFGGRATAGATPAPAKDIKAGPDVAAVPPQARIFPDATLDLSRIRAMDADVTYKALSIRNAPVHLTAGSVRLRLDDALLKADPLRFQLPQGTVAGYVHLNARKTVPVTDLDLRLSNARIEHLIPLRFGGSAPLTGAVVGRAKLTGSGNSVHKAFASADGQVMVVAPGGEIRKAFAELMGVNVVKGLGLLLKKDQDTTPIRCGVVHFDTKNGVMTADRFVLDTGPVLITGKGTINLDTERMAFQARGHDKKFRLLRVLLPVTAEGPIRSPKLGVKPGSAIAQGAAAVGLGALISPLAAIFPFIDPGLAKDANCGALVADAAQHGAPVKSAR
jgi:uncharacterized protein involved in outer membrane biogenesis